MTTNDEIEEQYQNEKKAIQKELEIELRLGGGHYTPRANELYKQLRELVSWYNEEKR